MTVSMLHGPHPHSAGAAVGELASAHCYAADFGTVLEWCTARTDKLFRTGPRLAGSDSESDSTPDDRKCGMPRSSMPWNEAQLAYRLVRDARQAERRLGGEVA